MLKRLQRLWKLSKLPDEVGHEELRALLKEPLGDGKAEWLGDDMTEDEYNEFEREEVNGWKKVRQRLGL